VSVELATAFVHLQSSTRGLGKQITKEFGPLQPAASEAGDEASEGFAERFKGGLKKSMAVVGAVGGAIAAKGFLDATSKEAGSDLLAARIGLSPEESARIGKIAGGLYGNAYGEDLGQVNDAIDGIKVNMGDLGSFSDKELTDMGAKALDLSKIMDEDVGRVTRGVGQLMRNGLAKDGTEAFDLITAASQKLPKEMRGELLDTIEEYSADLSSLGLTGPQAMGALSASVKAGARNTDLAADALRELSIRGIDGTKATAAGFTALGLDADVMAQKLAAGGPSAQKATSEIIQALSGMSDPIAQEAAGVALFGTRYEELGPKAIAALDPATAGLTDYEGAAKKAGDTLNDNTASSVEGFKRKASEMASNLAAKAIPHLEKLGRGFAGLPGPAQAAIAGLGGLAVAAGPISNTVDGVKNLATHAKSLGSSMVSVGTKMGSAASKATTLATNLGRTAASGAKSAIVGIGNAAKTAGTAALSGAKSLGAWALAAGKSAASAIASTASIVAQKVAMLAGKVATGIATAAQWLWNAALTANPIGLVIAAIVGIVAALVLAYNKVGWFKAFVDAAFRGISAVVGWVVNFIRNNWQTLLAILTGPIGLAVLFITKNWDTIKAGFGTVKAFIVGAISAIAGWFISKWQGIARVAQSIVDGLRSGWTKAKDWVISMVAKMVASIVGVKNRVTGSLGRVFDTLKSGATKARNFVTSMVARIVSTVVGIKNRVLSSLRAVFRPLTSAATTARNFVTSMVARIVSTVVGIKNRVLSSLRAVFRPLTSAATTARNFVTSMVARIVSTVVGIKNRVTGSLGRVFDTLKSGATKAKNWVDGKVSALVNLITGIPRRIGNMASAISEPFKWAFSRIAQFWNNTAGKLSFTAPSWMPGIGGKGFSMPKLPTYHTGGEVLGPKGQEVPIMALAGERVLSLKETAAYDAGRPSGRGGTDPIYQLRGATVVLSVNARGFADGIRKAELVRR
jgi:phage-related protein